jgi:hypothetical protein
VAAQLGGGLTLDVTEARSLEPVNSQTFGYDCHGYSVKFFVNEHHSYKTRPCMDQLWAIASWILQAGTIEDSVDWLEASDRAQSHFAARNRFPFERVQRSGRYWMTHHSGQQFELTRCPATIGTLESAHNLFCEVSSNAPSACAPAKPGVNQPFFSLVKLHQLT